MQLELRETAHPRLGEKGNGVVRMVIGATTSCNGEDASLVAIEEWVGEAAEESQRVVIPSVVDVTAVEPQPGVEVEMSPDGWKFVFVVVAGSV